MSTGNQSYANKPPLIWLSSKRTAKSVQTVQRVRPVSKPRGSGFFSSVSVFLLLHTIYRKKKLNVRWFTVILETSKYR